MYPGRFAVYDGKDARYHGYGVPVRAKRSEATRIGRRAHRAAAARCAPGGVPASAQKIETKKSLPRAVAHELLPVHRDASQQRAQLRAAGPALADGPLRGPGDGCGPVQWPRGVGTVGRKLAGQCGHGGTDAREGVALHGRRSRRHRDALRILWTRQHRRHRSRRDEGHRAVPVPGRAGPVRRHHRRDAEDRRAPQRVDHAERCHCRLQLALAHFAFSS